MNRSTVTYIALSWAIASATLHAQNPRGGQSDTLRRELTVVTDKVISVPVEKGLPVSVSTKAPQVRPFSATPLKFQMHYAPSLPANIDGHVSPIAERFIHSPHRGYLELGAGTLYRFRADAGYRILNTEKDELYFDLHHRSALEDVTDADKAVKTKDRNSLTDVSGLYTHRFEKTSLSVTADYRHRYYNYYGVWPDLNQIVPSTKNFRYDSKDHAVEHGVRVKAGLSSQANDTDNWAYSLRLMYGYHTRFAQFSGQNYDLVEHYPKAELGISRRVVGDLSFHVDADAGVVYLSPKKRLDLHARPNVKRSERGLYFAGGKHYLNLDTSVGTTEIRIRGGFGASINGGVSPKIFLYPLLDASISFADAYRIYAESEGGLLHNNLRQISGENPYLLPEYVIDPSRVRYKARLGAGAAITQRLNLGLYADLAKIDHYYLFRPADMQDNGSALINQAFRKHVGFTPYYDNVSMWGFGGHLSYSIRGIWGISAKAQYSRWNRSSKKDIVDGKPSVEATISMYYQPLKPFKLSFDYTFVGGIEYNQPQEGGLKDSRLPNIQLMNARLDYYLNNRIALYAIGRNIFFTHYSHHYGYPAPGAGVMAGANINF
ncbi:hypothetical protein HQ45_01290 [Porphyromonas crevioricanis]|uniref:Outer membrane cobalamin receptor protein n=1 Tax=Porphyromonas crevioricanis TaxID=393921 RepID=A0A0A2FL65_9PORP|nr:hypothetical protein [Porphyromonas crevioricanis]KGN90785.1 hypothetical protein HQ45_01290 [Porphyromonas crevioricanis]GAD06944.1 hypothetical protein PORCAN_554 [Porphyromonas crevioricanis JCM 13913]SQH72889.1 Outer membrane cobalamin receptor protein [Porphyromonas crevioricanis]